VVKNALLVPGDEDVLVTVAVVVPNRHTHSKQIGRDAGLVGDVRESPVAFVAVEGVMRGVLGRKNTDSPVFTSSKSMQPSLL
jgi:hypothetical protein